LKASRVWRVLVETNMGKLNARRRRKRNRIGNGESLVPRRTWYASMMLEDPLLSVSMMAALSMRRAHQIAVNENAAHH
jgi:hypothetical protein